MNKKGQKANLTVRGETYELLQEIKAALKKQMHMDVNSTFVIKMALNKLKADICKQ